MPEIIKAGHLFIAQPPLFKVSKGRSEVYVKDQGELDRYLVEAGLQGRVLENNLGIVRGGAELSGLVDHALRMKNLMAFVPRKYDSAVVEAMGLSGALDPALAEAARMTALEKAARHLGMGDPEAAWSVERRDDGSVIFARLWRGVTDVHEIEAAFLTSAEARKMHQLATQMAEFYDAPARLTKGSAEAEPEPETSGDDEETPAVSVVADGGITRPAQLLEAVLEAGRKGLSISRYKGLGEMNAEQLWETTLDPENRVLLQVKVEDADVTDEIFTRLMGDVVEPRRDENRFAQAILSEAIFPSIRAKRYRNSIGLPGKFPSTRAVTIGS
ncbi:MAG: hypothetical protein B7Z07_02595 [Sphingomonadales bacterium 32-67-7]|nr:MAG: hypothetical protein B7Z07_02595 [Sphingomonadales bacterium 32-67-7]